MLFGHKKDTIPTKELIKYFSFLIRSLRVGFSVQDAHFRYRPPEKYKKMFLFVGNAIKRGSSFSSALLKAKVCKNDIATIIKAGEDSSRLMESLESIKKSLQDKQQMKKEVIRILTMPAVELVFGFIAFNIALLVVLQKLKPVILQLGNVPAISQILFNVSDFYKDKFIFFLLAYGVLGFFAYRSIENIKMFLFRISFFRSFYQYYFCKNFFFQLNLYLSSGMSIIHSLKEIEKSVKSEFERKYLLSLIRGIQKGMSFDDAARKCAIKLIPDDIIDIISISKHTGNYTDVVEEIVQYSSEEYKHSLLRMASFIEPAVIFFLAILVFVLILSVYYPIFTMGSNFSR